VRVGGASLLHLSDIHFGHDYGFPTSQGPGQTPLLELIERDLREDRIGIVVISGDITSRADANVLQDEGLRFLRELSTRLKVPRECFVIVPGNHDIALKKFRPQDYSHESSFHLFTKEFYGYHTSYPSVRTYQLPNGRTLDILAINSVRLRHETEKQFGYVQWSLFDDALQSTPRSDDSFRIAVLHHHLVPAPRQESIDPDYPEAAASITLDAGAVIEGLQAHGFGLALHGHQHVPAATRVGRGCSPYGKVNLKRLNGVVVLAAGSAGSSRLPDEMRDNSYNVLRFNKKGFVAEARRYNRALEPQSLFEVQSS
jgi:3',5'-cyclic AMP phosphodiesterase CpdA